jgi:hypothetical protein
VIGACDSCHTKSVNHVSTTNNCQACHSTQAWVPVNNVDHSQVLGECSACHTKSAGHILSTNVCDACHNTNAWRPVTVVDHDHVLGSCRSCHLNDLPGDHCDIGAQDCGECHAYPDWGDTSEDC